MKGWKERQPCLPPAKLPSCGSAAPGWLALSKAKAVCHLTRGPAVFPRMPAAHVSYSSSLPVLRPDGNVHSARCRVGTGRRCMGCDGLPHRADHRDPADLYIAWERRRLRWGKQRATTACYRPNAGCASPATCRPSERSKRAPRGNTPPAARQLPPPPPRLCRRCCSPCRLTCPAGSSWGWSASSCTRPLGCMAPACGARS